MSSTTERHDDQRDDAPAHDADHDAHDEGHNHPGVKEYVEIGVILAVLTAMEIALYYLPVPAEVAVPALIFLTIMKFVLVVLWFMHLRFDSPWFRRTFALGLGFAFVIYTITTILSL